MAAESRELLTRFHAAIGREHWSSEIGLVARRFVTNHRIAHGHPLFDPLQQLLQAHLARAGGASSPADCDAILRSLVTT